MSATYTQAQLACIALYCHHTILILWCSNKRLMFRLLLAKPQAWKCYR